MSLFRRKLMLNQLKKNSLPDGYSSYDYLISGGGAYIDTGIKLSNKDNIHLSLKSKQTSKGFIVGVEESDKSFEIRFDNYWFVIRINGESVYRQYGSIQNTINIYISNGKILIDGSEKAEGLTIPEFNNNLYLFANNKNGELEVGSKNTIYIKRLRVTGTNNLDMVPCQNEKGEKGMYDLIGNEFYGNQNEGNDFIVE